MGQFGIGQPLRRLEDPRLLTGRGRFIDDVALPRMAHAVLVRAPHAHAEIRGIDRDAAAAMPGVLAVLTAAELEADGIGDNPALFVPPPWRGRDSVVPPHRLLARDRARFVGDRVAMVVAETLLQARDAAEAVRVEYAPLAAVTTPTQAAAPEAPQIWPQAEGNVGFTWESGDPAAVEAAFAAAAHTVALDLINNRIVANYMETRGAIGEFDPGSRRYTLHTGTQQPHRTRRALAEPVLRVPERDLRVLVGDTGGSFGIKNSSYPEQGLVLWAARRVGRPVKWIAERGEGFLADSGGRDNETRAELALDADGRARAIRVRTRANLGAYLNNNTCFVPIGGTATLTGVYDIPAAHVRVQGLFTNTVHTDAYRGAGRPEASYVIERLMDAAARRIGLDPAEIRRRNYIAPDAFPYRTALGLDYDSGPFADNMDRAMAAADWDGAAARKADAVRRGRLRGIGMANYIERCGGGALDETAELRFDPSGALTLLIGTQSNGQGHQTAYAQIVAEKLGLDPADLRVLQGDTDAVGQGNGTGGSRSIPVGGAALAAACARVIDKGRRLAAHALEAAVEDIDFADGAFAVAGTDRRIALAEVARRSFQIANLPPGEETGLDERASFQPQGFTYPNGVHICELEIDPETGAVDLCRYVVVDDFGVLINPLLVDGQVHGGIAQGLGQALMEHTVYDPASGQLLSGSLMDYALPRAADFPEMEVAYNADAPCRTNPLGVKGAGEAGSVGAPPAAINAVLDALAPLGIDHIDMPATPQRIWAAIRAAAS